MSEGICLHRFSIQTEITNTGRAVVFSTAKEGRHDMTLRDFYKLAEYVNRAWRGKFTAEEAKEAARMYYREYRDNAHSDVLRSLVEGLAEDLKYGDVPDVVRLAVEVLTW